MSNPVFTYYCIDCGSRATKDPVSESKSLGTWHCSKCGKVKVRRERNKVEK